MNLDNFFRSGDDKADLICLLDCAYDRMELWTPEKSEKYNIALREQWLKRARELGAEPSFWATPQMITSNLEWQKGPAEGGGGTAGVGVDGNSLWYDGDRLLVIVEGEKERGVYYLKINTDKHYFIVRDANTGEDFSDFGPKEWSWWAKLDKKNLPPVIKE